MDATTRQRIITALIAAPVALACVFLLPPVGFAVFVGLVVVVAAWEWANFAGLSQPWRVAYAVLVAVVLAASFALYYSDGYFLLSTISAIFVASTLWWLLALLLVLTYPASARFFTGRLAVLLIGLLVLTATWAALLLLRYIPYFELLICLLFFLVWGADIGAYFAGRKFGGAKLAPSISPGKTWAGFCGGMALALIISFLMMLWVAGQSRLPHPLSGVGILFLAAFVLVAAASVLGDLTISMFKRNRNIKDTSNLLPGHGGVLDRVDSLLAAAPIFAAGFLMLIFVS